MVPKSFHIDINDDRVAVIAEFSAPLAFDFSQTGGNGFGDFRMDMADGGEGVVKFLPCRVRRKVALQGEPEQFGGRVAGRYGLQSVMGGLIIDDAMA